jgi:hypothetical protein
LIDKEKKEHSSVFVTVGERERVEKDPSFVDFSMGMYVLCGIEPQETNHMYLVCLLLVICLSSRSLSSLALFFIGTTCCLEIDSHIERSNSLQGRTCFVPLFN